MPTLDAIRCALAGHEPAVLDHLESRRAAVAMLLREQAGAPEVLFIERASREGDPWSGHMAFPGGRVDPEDPHARGAAERETLEEVGVDLGDATPLGRLDDLQGQRVAGVPQLVVSAFVYHLPASPPLVPNHEVREAFWFPLRALLEPQRHVEYSAGSREWKGFPGILVGEPERHVVWGLTYRFLEIFFELVGQPLPNRWSAAQVGSPQPES